MSATPARRRVAVALGGYSWRVQASIVAGHTDQERPLTAYGAMLAAFNVAAGAGIALAARSGRLPARIDAGDIVLYGIATAKVSRIVTRARVTSALRAPFTRFESDAGHGEVDERARGRGLRRAIGELLVCPHCLSQWVAATFMAGHLAQPRVARTAASTFAIVWVAEQANAAERRFAT